MPDYSEILSANVGHYLEKVWDWHAFPSNEGYPELDRAQMRYVGSGGSPKTDDRTTLRPGAFTCSLIYQEPGHRASTHHHQIEELFFVHRGQLTMTWQFGDECVDFIVGPGDAILNPRGRPHGFRNDGPDDCVMQIMVATAAPMLPTYTDHPSEFTVSPLNAAPAARIPGYMAEIEKYLARAADVKPIATAVEGGTVTVSPYMMARDLGGIVEPAHFTFAIHRLSRGAVTPVYQRNVEEAFMIVDGVVEVEIGEGEDVAVERLGARDLALVPAGVSRRLRNVDAGIGTVASIVGSAETTPVAWNDTSVKASGVAYGSLGGSA